MISLQVCPPRHMYILYRILPMIYVCVSIVNKLETVTVPDVAIHLIMDWKEVCDLSLSGFVDKHFGKRLILYFQKFGDFLIEMRDLNTAETFVECTNSTMSHSSRHLIRQRSQRRGQPRNQPRCPTFNVKLNKFLLISTT